MRLKHKLNLILLFGVSVSVGAFILLLILKKTPAISIPAPWNNTKQAAYVEPTTVNKTAQEKCLTLAYKNFTAEWNKKCETDGINSRKANCNLPSEVSTTINQHWEAAKKECYK